MRDVHVGPELEEFCAWAVRADLPVLLLGKHGVGKSESLRAVARKLDIGFITLNLSALEPVDLQGMPRIVGEQVEYVAPAWFPTSGNGILLLDEITRAPRHLRAPLYQLLTERGLNGRPLAKGWVPVAAANIGGTYDVDELDGAFTSRFVCVRVTAAVDSWLKWARDAGVHERVLDFAALHPDLFENAESNPRAWEGVSKLLHAGERDQLNPHACGSSPTPLLQKLVAGLVGDVWSAAFWQHYINACRPLEPTSIITQYATQRPTVAQWVSQKRMDLLHHTMKMLQGHLQSQAIHDAVVAKDIQRLNVIAFAQDLPAELRKKWSVWVKDREFPRLAIPRRRA
ncbi:MAG TPA: AAA family ATPase [Thermoanaerobaculia bacterium]|jgi:hypothetical protein